MKFLKKLSKFLVIILFLLILSFAGFLLYALRPGISPQLLVRDGIIQYSVSAVPQNDPAQLKVVTYNIGYASGRKNNQGDLLSKEEVEKNLKEMSEALKKLQPDILFLQEVDFHSKRSFGTNQLQYLAETLQMPYGAYVLTWNKQYVAWPYWPLQHHFGRVVSGSAVLSRFPIKNQKLIDFPKPTNNPFWYNWFYLDRIAQKLDLEVGAKKVSLYALHLEAFDREERNQQLEKLSKMIAEDPNPNKLVGGDFNLASVKIPGAKVEETDIEGMLKTFADQTGLKNAEPTPPVLSMPSWNPVKKIDHIFYSDGFQLLESGNITGLLASDHLPIWAKFSL